MTLHIHSNSFKFIQSKAQNLYKMLSSFSFNLNFLCIFVISNNKSFIYQNLKVVGPLGGKFDFFSSSGFEIQSDFVYRTVKFKIYSVRALKCYVNKKNLMHCRVTATISKGPVKLIKWVKIAHPFLLSVSDQFHVIILSLSV